MSAFLAAYWPVLALLYVLAVLMILRFFQLGACGDDRCDECADGDYFPFIPTTDAPALHAVSYDSEVQRNHG